LIARGADGWGRRGTESALTARNSSRPQPCGQPASLGEELENVGSRWRSTSRPRRVHRHDRLASRFTGLPSIRLPRSSRGMLAGVLLDRHLPRPGRRGYLSDLVGGETTGILALGIMAAGDPDDPFGDFYLSVAAEIIMAIGMGVANAAVFKLVAQEIPRPDGRRRRWVGGLGAFGGSPSPRSWDHRAGAGDRRLRERVCGLLLPGGALPSSRRDPQTETRQRSPVTNMIGNPLEDKSMRERPGYFASCSSW